VYLIKLFISSFSVFRVILYVNSKFQIHATNRSLNYFFIKRYYFAGNPPLSDFAIPRLTSDNDDMYMKMGLSENADDAIFYGECLVGRFCPYYQHSDLFALTDEDGFVVIQDTSIKGEGSMKCSKYS
jgi:hypothetical protein